MSNKTDPTQLYRFFDAEGVLLYVGITKNLPARLSQHSKTQHWYWRVSDIKIESFITREEAANEEVAAIHHEHPLFNITDARPPEDDEQPATGLYYSPNSGEGRVSLDSKFMIGNSTLAKSDIIADWMIDLYACYLEELIEIEGMIRETNEADEFIAIRLKSMQQFLGHEK